MNAQAKLPRSQKQKIERAAQIVGILADRYPAAECALRYEGDPFRLLVMAILSAQCTDARVNTVSETLFAHFPTPAAMAEAEIAQIENDVRSCGLYRTKAEHIRQASAILVRDYDGKVPADMDALLSLPGVGRKIANLIRGDIFSLPAIVTDTHCIRIAGRLGLCTPGDKNPLRVERALTALIAPAEQSDFCHRLVLFGRDCCTARAPHCTDCPLAAYCVQP